MQGFASKYTLYPGSDQVLTLSGLSDVLTGLFQDGASVTATLYDQFGNAVPGCSGIQMNYVVGSFGDFQGEIVGTAFNPPLASDGRNVSGYRLVITAVDGSVTAVWTLLVDLAARNKS